MADFWKREFEMMLDDVVHQAGELLARHDVAAYSEGHFVRTDYTIIPKEEAAAIVAELDKIVSPMTIHRRSITDRRDMLIDTALAMTPKGKKSKVARYLADKYGLKPHSLRTRSYRKKKL